MTKICIIGYNPCKIGGIESFSRSLKGILSYKVDYVYEYDETGPFEVLDTYPALKYSIINRAVNKISNGYLCLSKIKKKIIKENYDVLILNSPKYLSIVPALQKVILVQHTTVDNWWKSKFKFNNDLNLLNLSRKVHKIISLSDYERSELLTRFNYPHELVQSINMINDIPINNNYITPQKKLIMLTRFQNKIKRIDLVIKSMYLLPDFELNIYGDGIDKDYLISLSKDLKNVRIHPSTNKKIQVLDRNSIYILSSEFEGFPVSLLEAMSRGLPLIIRNSFLSAPCFIKGNGVLIDKTWSSESFKDAVLYCYSNYQSLSMKSLKLAEEYQPEYVRSAWCNLIDGVIQSEK